MFKVFIHQIVIQASVSQSIRAMWAFSYVSWGIMWVTKEQQKCTHKLKSRLNGIKDELMRRQLKKRSPAVCAGLNIAGHIEALMASNTRDQSYALSTNKMVTGPPLFLSLTDFLTSQTPQPLE